MAEECGYKEYQKLPRYTVGLQKPKVSNCFVDIHECRSLDEAKRKADSESEKTGRQAIVFDRQGILPIIYTTALAVIEPVVEPVVKKKAAATIKRKM